MQDKVNQFFRTIPVAKAVLLAVVFLLSAAFAGGCWWLKASAEKDAALADDKLKAQQTLALPYARLLERQRSLTALVKRTPSKPMPAAITDLNRLLAEVAKEAGLPGARFVPDGVSVVGSSSLRFTVTAEGSAENFRRFLLVLSDQHWVSDVNNVDVKSGTPLHTLSARFNATCRAFQKGGAQ